MCVNKRVWFWIEIKTPSGIANRAMGKLAGFTRRGKMVRRGKLCWKKLLEENWRKCWQTGFARRGNMVLTEGQFVSEKNTQIEGWKALAVISLLEARNTRKKHRDDLTWKESRKRRITNSAWNHVPCLYKRLKNCKKLLSMIYWTFELIKRRKVCLVYGRLFLIRPSDPKNVASKSGFLTNLRRKSCGRQR